MDITGIIAFFTSFLSNQNQILKIVLILLELLFALFTLVLARQITLLTNMLNQVSFTPIFRFIAYALIIASIALLVITILV